MITKERPQGVTRRRPSASGRPGSVLVLSLGGEQIRVLQAALRGGELVVTASGTAPAGGDEDATARAVQELLTRSGINERRVIVVLPAQSMALKQVDLPPAAADQLAQLVTFEAQRHLPLPIDQLAVGYQVLRGTVPTGSAGTVGTEVLVAVIRKTELSRLERALAAVGLTVEGYAVDTLAALDACLPASGIAANGKADLLLAADAGTLHAHVVAGGRLLLSRSLDTAEEGWASDLRRSLATFSLGHGETPIAASIFFGDSAVTEVAQAVGVPVERGAIPPGESQGLKAPESWLAPLGAARQWLGEGQFPLRIEPQGWAVSSGRGGRGLALAGALAALVLAAGFVAWRLNSTRKQDRESLLAREEAKQTDQLETRLKRLNGERADLTAQEAAVSGVAGATPPLQVLRTISDKLPDQVWMTGLHYQAGKPVQIEGTSKTASAATGFLRGLNGLPIFKRAELGFLRSADENGVPVTHFRIDCYPPGADDRGRLTGREALP